ncbi:MAG: neutral/alkaline non-lysosomal ceramidase N-terminal domain-containing protein [Prolixibacteraceae bacterium]|nr:neutral/alkaline non-lysosomal ceramidase N-terminal domain-containing protein [Prolixibacteraceae bacterium]
MKKVLLYIALMPVLLYSCHTISTETSIKVGVGETVITPSENMQMAGFSRSQVSAGVHDDLHARSLVVEDQSGNTVVLMSVSLIGVSRQIADRIREGITKQTGVAGDNVIISATHTHSGPSVGRRDEDSPSYEKFVIEQCIESAVLAWKNRQPGRIGIEPAEVFELGRNRRRLLYGGVHPDPEVAIIKIENARGQLLGVAFNYGCHPSGLDWSNTLISEDWPYFAIQKIKEAVGDDVWVAFYQSAEGNINIGYTAELSAVGVEMPVRTYWYIEKKGEQMAEAVLKSLPSVNTLNNPDVRIAKSEFEYPLRKSYPVTTDEAEQEAEAAKKRLAEMEGKPEYQGTRTLDMARVDLFSTTQKLNASKKYSGNASQPEIRTLEQQCVRIGDAVFVTFPGELFAEIGLRIKENSPLVKTFVIGMTAGGGGYLPAAREFIDGDYEVDGSAYGPEAEEACVKFSLDMIRRVAK